MTEDQHRAALMEIATQWNEAVIRAGDEGYEVDIRMGAVRFENGAKCITMGVGIERFDPMKYREQQAGMREVNRQIDELNQRE